ncbi:pseudouridine synthase [Mucilaginibacter terrenus]|uniref:Pseudouridine synthase n=1 Tax=Mucilaginibacter terrenus TaxID=2482727 RepID=A0A3E2NL10_9SPHI|nr:pseudouridine synthase [Mucilaginibacter terrenus]RFZ81676.1 pseudouridine synthase [Mucilaginibacter terrenus]
MVFKRPTGSRDDKPNRSTRRTDGGDNTSKRSSSAPGKPYGSRAAGDKKEFSPGRKPSNNRSFTGNNQPEGDRPNRSGNAPSFGDKPRRSPSAPSYGDKPKRNAGASSYGDNARRGTGAPSYGDKKPFNPSAKPFGNRTEGDSNEKGGRRGYGDAASGDRKPYGGKKPFVSGQTNTDRPKRSFSGDRPTGEGKPRTGTGYANSTGKKDFRSTTSGFKRRDENRSEADAPKRTMRSRKNPVQKESDLIRLNRYIANAGICSRRKADELIQAGVISVNGEVVNELGYKVDPIKDLVRYNGEALKREKMVYVLLNKPKDYITTTEDPQERRTVMHLVEKASRERIYPVGRLDRNTTGLLLMTNDGDLADKLSHPRNNIVKLYNVELNKSLTQGDLNKIEFGLELEDGFIKPDSISYVTGGTKREVGIQIHSGKNRIVRRIFESLGYEVVKLDRSVYANLTKKDLPRGRWRYLDEKELIQLKHLI